MPIDRSQGRVRISPQIVHYTFPTNVITLVITMVELKVRKFGNSLGVILPKEILQRLNATEGQRLLLIESPEGAFQLQASDPELELQMKIAREGMDRYRNTLRILAK